MNLSAQLARHLREVHFGENWTWSNLKDQLADINWQDSTISVHSCNSIATLVYHMNYYLGVVSNRVQAKPLVGKHEDSFRHPPIGSKEDWDNLVSKTWTDAEAFASYIEGLPDSRLWEVFSEKYGTVYRNIQGVIEHNHYHLGQIVVLKKIIREMKKSEFLASHKDPAEGSAKVQG
jgi:hypothetical protein